MWQVRILGIEAIQNRCETTHHRTKWTEARSICTEGVVTMLDILSDLFHMTLLFFCQSYTKCELNFVLLVFYYSISI